MSSFCISCLSSRDLFLYLFWSALTLGWMACMAAIERIWRTNTGTIIRRTVAVIRMIARPQLPTQP